MSEEAYTRDSEGVDKRDLTFQGVNSKAIIHVSALQNTSGMSDDIETKSDRTHMSGEKRTKGFKELKGR